MRAKNNRAQTFISTSGRSLHYKLKSEVGKNLSLPNKIKFLFNCITRYSQFFDEHQEMKKYDIIVVGGGQSGLSVGYYLRRTDLDYIILDQEEEAGGAWQHFWDSLRLFSPAKWSSLPGVIMSGGPDYYPTKDETIDYLQTYEEKYNIRVERPVKVRSVKKDDGLFHLETSDKAYQSRALVSATGTFRNPYIPDIPGINTFDGPLIHSSEYRSPDPFEGQRVAIVGGGNSGAQILAEVSRVADTLWITKEPPHFLPDDVDGRYLFDVATKLYNAKKQGKEFEPPSLGDIVMVDKVKEARERGVLQSVSPSFQRFEGNTLVWANGREDMIDAVIFCTGFDPALDYLQGLKNIDQNDKIRTNHARAIAVDGLWLVGYGNWTGFASATLIGVGRSARKTVNEVTAYVEKSHSF